MNKPSKLSHQTTTNNEERRHVRYMQSRESLSVESQHSMLSKESVYDTHEDFSINVEARDEELQISHGAGGGVNRDIVGGDHGAESDSDSDGDGRDHGRRGRGENVGSGPGNRGSRGTTGRRGVIGRVGGSRGVSDEKKRISTTSSSSGGIQKSSVRGKRRIPNLDRSRGATKR